MIAAVALLAAAVVLLWPARTAAGRFGQAMGVPVTTVSLAGVRDAVRERWPSIVAAPRRTVAAAAVLVGLFALLWQGPVAGLCAAVYAALAAGAVLDRATRRAAEASRRETEASLAALAADLRAGAHPPDAIRHAGFLDGPGGPATLHEVASSEPVRRLAAAWEVAEATGAGLAAVLDRLEADLAATRRRRARMAAEAAGASMTARLLAGLPLVGVAMGYALSADPLRMLLHTPTGAVCCIAAVALQTAGLRWSRRIVDSAGGPSWS
jgi:tight adherence protein B